MHFPFDFEKTLEAAGVLLDADEGCMGFLRLLKLLYVTDRELLAETGRPLTGDRAVALKNGPVLNRVYDTIKGQSVDADRWSDFVHKDGYKVVLKQKPGRRKLSKREIAKLQEVTERYRQLEDFELADKTHDFSEWKKNYQEGAAAPIPWEDALLAQDKADMIPVARKEAEARAAVDAIFGS